MRKFLSLLLVLMYLCLPAAAEETNMIYNPDFSSLDSSLLPEGWYRDMWYTDAGVSYLEVSDISADGSCIKVVNASENDARFCQDIVVEPDTLYEIRCLARAEGIPEGGIGANISIKDTFSYSANIYDTGGEWVELVMYGRTGADQTLLTLCARVGGYSSLNTGSAWFDSFEMRPADSVPAGYTELSFAAIGSSGGDSSETADETEPERYTEAWLLAAFGIALAFAALCRKSGRLPSEGRSARIIFVCALSAALVIRLAIAFLVRGYNTDINCFTAWSELMHAMGPAGFYSSKYFCDYPPVYMLMLGLVSILRSLFGISYQSAAHIALIKLVPILFDLGLAALIYAFARRRAGERIALMLGLVCALNPASIVDSAAWGQIDSVFTFFTILGAVYLSEGRYSRALPSIALAMLIKPQALLFAPLGLAALIVDISRAGNRKKSLIDAFVGLGIALAMLLLAGFIFHPDGMGPVEWLVSLYSGTMNGYPRFTVNAFNLYELIGLNWAELSSNSGLAVLAWVLFALAYLYSFFIYFRSGRRSTLFISAAALIMLICAFSPMIHERYVYPALILLLMAYACERDWRLLVSLGLLSVTLFMNEMLVLQGGMTAANYGHLQSSEDWLNHAMSLLVVINAAFMVYVSMDIAVLGRRRDAADETPDSDKIFSTGTGAESIFRTRDWRLGLKRMDYILMAAVTLVYSVLAFVNLGSLSAPETSFVSSQAGESIVFDLGKTRAWRMEYYGGICNTTFTVEISDDGESWTSPVYAVYDQGEIFRWLFFVPSDENQNTVYNQTNIAADGTQLVYASSADAYPCQRSRYVRITALSAGLTLTEIGFLDENAEPYPVTIASHEGYLEGYRSDPQALIDEQDTVPEHPSYLNSTYFDEIYHARTAYEHLHGLKTYEWTHPPLGKVLMMIGIKLFGMCPFGWRFMGALAGVLMLPVIYLMAKQLGASTKVSAVAMLLLALDSMHFTQTRIATIDSYSVLWIMVMYLFMFRYVKMNFHREPLGKTLVPLALCGVTMGLAWATKWIGIYASAGLVILFFWSFIERYAEHRRALGIKEADALIRNARTQYWRKALITTGVCVICFIVIPLLIYYFSYYWQLRYEGGLSIKRVLQLQESMFSYHSGLGGDTHYFRSPWYEWPVIAWPMWYYKGSQYLAEGMISSISCMGNPAVWWTGLAALIFTLVNSAWKKRADWVSVVLIIGFMSQYLPWVLVPRSTFIYHYFASVPFIILMTAFALGRLEKGRDGGAAFHISSGILLALALLLFIMFYPLESGLPMSESYAVHLRWFNWYNY